ncbi:MAG: TRAP-type mannitol/chloroaromatic compound transport system permease small subunit [Lentisphaeria bacterium]|jgi:TRAP-type mannitol/chloroaromatic compound transport system permease small subunit
MRLYLLLSSIHQKIEQLHDAIGKTLAWLTFFMVLVVCLVVTLRAVFNVGSIALQESVTYMHALVFMLCLGYTAKEQAHVRVDIFYRRFNAEQKAWVNAIGGVIFLLPFSLFMVLISWQFVSEAWRVHEGSGDPGGIQAIFLLKSVMPLAGILLALQGLANVLQNILVLTFKENPSDGAARAPVEALKHNN